MPVTSPSYFPPERGNNSIVGVTAGLNQIGARNFLGGNSAGNNVRIDDLIVLGYHAFDVGTIATPISDTDLSGTIVLGNSSARALIVAATGDVDQDKPSVIIGFRTAPAARNVAGCVVIGNGALASYTGLTTTANGAAQACVIIGQDALSTLNGTPGLGQPPSDSVVIGYRAAHGNINGLTNWFMRRSVVIGSKACEGTGDDGVQGGQLYDNVVIGYRAGSVLAFASTNGINNVLIGSQCYIGGNPSSCVIIGALNAAGSANPAATVAVGTVTSAGGNYNVYLGSDQPGSNGSRNIIIGGGAGQGESFGFGSLFIVEVNDVTGPTHNAMFYGNMATGNLITGRSVTGVDRDFDGAASRNILKLINGTPGALAPVGGGYFYAVAGALHWVGSAGTDTVIAPA